MTMTGGAATPPGSSASAGRAGDADADQRSLTARAGELSRKATDELSEKRWLWPRRSAPELRKVLASLPEALDETCRLLGRRTSSRSATAPGLGLDDATRARLAALLDTDPATLDLDGAWQLLEGLQLLWLTLGAADPDYVRALLDVERGLAARPGDDWEEPWPYYGWGRVRWDQAFGAEVPIPADPGPETVERLQVLFRMRIENGRKRRARLALRSRFFVWSLLVLAPLIAGLMAVTQRVGDDVSWWTVAVVALAGGVGGTVSGTLKLRGLIRITQFRLLGAGLFVQPFIGAAAALFTAFVLLSGLVELPGVDAGANTWAALAAYGFAAGFSEPFWLGVVRKVAGDTGSGSQPVP